VPTYFLLYNVAVSVSVGFYRMTHGDAFQSDEEQEAETNAVLTRVAPSTHCNHEHRCKYTSGPSITSLQSLEPLCVESQKTRHSKQTNVMTSLFREDDVNNLSKEFSRLYICDAISVPCDTLENTESVISDSHPRDVFVELCLDTSHVDDVTCVYDVDSMASESKESDRKEGKAVYKLTGW